MRAIVVPGSGRFEAFAENSVTRITSGLPDLNDQTLVGIAGSAIPELILGCTYGSSDLVNGQ